MDTYTRINTLRLASSTANKILMDCGTLDDSGQSYFILGGLDLKLLDTDLSLMDEHSRKSKENSVKFAAMIKSDKFVVATNSDLEIFG